MNDKELFTAVVEQLSSNSIPVKLGKDPQTNYDSVIYTYGAVAKTSITVWTATTLQASFKFLCVQSHRRFARGLPCFSF